MSGGSDGGMERFTANIPDLRAASNEVADLGSRFVDAFADTASAATSALAPNATYSHLQRAIGQIVAEIMRAADRLGKEYAAQSTEFTRTADRFEQAEWEHQRAARAVRDAGTTVGRTVA